MRACLSRFKTVLEKIPYLVPKAPYRRSGQALTTLNQLPKTKIALKCVLRRFKTFQV